MSNWPGKFFHPFFKKGEIVKGSGIDRKTYERMVKKENEIWGKLWTDENRNQIIKDEQEAAAALGLNRDSLVLKKYFLDNRITCEHGLSLACGEGRAEREYISQGVCKRFDAIDVSEKAIQRAKAMAHEESLPIQYSCADLNFCRLEEGKYDLVITQTCLHHILNLEHLVDQIAKSLKPNGFLWIHDYIGESRFQYSDLRLQTVNSILAALPAELKFHRLQQKQIDKIVRKDPDKIISPFEAIRSAEILTVFLKHFKILEKYENNSILHLVCQTGMRRNYLDYKNGRILFDFLHGLDRAFIESGMLSPTGGQYIMRPISA